MRDRDLCPAHPAALGQPGVLHGEVVLAVHAADRAGGLDEHVVEPLVPVPGAGRDALAGRFVDRGRAAQPTRPGAPRTGTWTCLPPVSAMNTCATLTPTPGMVQQQLDLMRPRRAGLPRSPRPARPARPRPACRRCRIERASRAWLASKLPVSASVSCGILPRSFALRQLRPAYARVALAVDHRGKHGPRRDRLQARHHRGQLDRKRPRASVPAGSSPGPVGQQLVAIAESAAAAGGCPVAARTTAAAARAQAVARSTPRRARRSSVPGRPSCAAR